MKSLNATKEFTIFHQEFKVRKMKTGTILFFLLFILAPIFAQQNPQPYFRNYGTEQGLPSPEVYCALEDRKGYMWFGTDNGASRFDGYSFRNFGVEDGLTSNVIINIHEDTLGRIWFGTLTGEAFFLEGDTILPYQYNHLVLQFRDRYTGSNLMNINSDGSSFFGLSDFKPLKISSDGQIDTIHSQRPHGVLAIHKKSFAETCHHWYRDKTHTDYENYYRETNQKPQTFLEIIDSDNKRFTFEIPNIDTFPGNDIQILPNDDFLFVNMGEIHCLRKNKILWSVPHLASIVEIIPEQDGVIWFCENLEGGLRRYQSIEAVKEGHYDLFFNGLSVSNLCNDTKGGYWVTTLQKGVFYVPNFQMLSYSKATGLSSDYVTSVAFKNENELFVGLHNNDIYLLDESNYTLNMSVINGYKGSHLPSMYYDSTRKVLWTGPNHYQQGKRTQCIHWDSVLRRLVPYSSDDWDNVNVNSKRQLVANFGAAGFVIVDMDQDTIQYVTWNKSPLLDRYYSLLYDSDDHLWMANDEGLFLFKDSTLVRPDTSIIHPAFYNRIESIKQFQNGSFALGSRGYGVLIWNEDTIRQFTTKDGLTSNMIEDMHIDNKGALWASTFKGLNKITFNKKGDVIIRTFNTANGLPSNEIYQIKSYQDQVWLCTAGGLVKFSETKKDSFSKTPLLQSVTVNDQILNNELNDKPRSGEKQSDLEICFKSNQNNFIFHYLAINYCQFGQIPYRYRIRHTDNWQYTQTRIANYPSLTPGDYNFEVQAQNQDGYWSKSAHFAFGIAYPWWATAWFRVLVGILMVGVIYIVYKNRIYQLAKKNQTQKEINNLERAALQAQMNPHFIFNCLNSIQNYILKNNKKKAVEFLSRFARLVRFNLNASVNGEIALEDEISILENYLALEQERFDYSFDYEIDVDKGLSAQFVEIPPMLIQPYVENAVIHGMANKKEKGNIHIIFAFNGREIIVTITDNGRGYKESSIFKKDSHHKSVGMSITQKRLEILSVDPDSSVQIRRLKDSRNKILGTEVKIQIEILDK